MLDNMEQIKEEQIMRLIKGKEALIGRLYERFKKDRILVDFIDLIESFNIFRGYLNLLKIMNPLLFKEIYEYRKEHIEEVINFITLERQSMKGCKI